MYLLLAHRLQEGFTDEGVDINQQSQYMIDTWRIERNSYCILELNVEMEVKPFNLQSKHLMQYLDRAEQENEKRVSDVLEIIVQSMLVNANDQFLVEFLNWYNCPKVIELDKKLSSKWLRYKSTF